MPLKVVAGKSNFDRLSTSVRNASVAIASNVNYSTTFHSVLGRGQYN